MKSKAKHRLEQIVDSFDQEKEEAICITIMPVDAKVSDCKLVEWHSPLGHVIREYTHLNKNVK